VSAVRQRALLLSQQGRHELAEKAWREVLSEQPDDAGAHASLALCLIERDSFDQAEAESRLGITCAPDSAFAHYAQARVLFARNRFTEAIAAVERAVQIEPEDADYRALLAGIHCEQSQWQQSLLAADAGLALDASHIGCANLRALALTHLSRKDEAATTIAGAMQRSPENSLTHTNQGWALLHAGDARRALGHFREALRLDASNQWAREGLLTALKAHNLLFRKMLAFFLFMSRQSSTARWMIVIGIFVGQNAARMVAVDYPQYGFIMWPIFIAFMAFVYLTWLANPLMNLTMRLHPIGRHALTANQRSQSGLIGLVLLIAVINLGVMACTGGVTFYAMVPFVLALPLSTIHTMASGWPRLVAVIVGVLFAAAAADIILTMHLIEFLATHPHFFWSAGNERTVVMLIQVAKELLTPYFFAILIWSFVSPMLSQVRPTR
jgi:tetratricopeptide (TPR) repeat protein